MSAKPTKVPGFPKPPTSISAELRKFLEAIVEAIEIRLGRRGDPLDRAVTLRELIDSGIASTKAAIPFDPNNVGAGNRGFQNPDDLIETDVPMQVVGFTVAAAYSQVIISWTFPNYRYHSQTQIWSHTSDSIGDATLAGVSTGRIFVDPIGSGASRYYWARHQNQENKVGPWNDTDGTLGQTATDVAHQLGVLSNAITSSQLATSLADPIGNLPANTNSEINTINSSITSINSTVAGHTTSIQTNVTSIDGVEAQYSVKIDNNNHVSGFGLSSTLVDATQTSAFIIRAERFAIIDRANTSVGLTNSPSADVVPFVIDSGNTYIKMAMIKDADITNAKIGDLSADKINAGTIGAAYIGANSIDASKVVIDGSVLVSDNSTNPPTLTIGPTSITAAYIGNAEISTLKLAGQAVTIPSSDGTSSAQTFTTTETELASVTFTSSGNPVFINASAYFKNYVSDEGASYYFRLYRNTTKVVEHNLQIGAVDISTGSGTNGSISFKETPSSGSVTYKIKAVRQSGNGTITAYESRVTCLEVKR